MKNNRKIAGMILKKIGSLVLVLLAVSLLCFALISASPVDPVRMFLGEVGMSQVSPDAYAKIQSYFGVDQPFLVRYGTWLWDFVRGDMGISLLYRQPVAQVISVRFFNSLMLMASAWVLSGLLGFFLGVAAGTREGSIGDKLIKGYSYLLAGTPTFWLALLFLMVFSVWLKWFPIGLSVPIGLEASKVTLAHTLKHLILPVITLSVTGVANIALHTREKMIEVMEQDYILYANAKGNSKKAVVRHHGLRNVVLPALTLQFASIGEIFGGSVLVEQVFSYPGLGQAAVNAGLGGDAPLLLGIAVVSAALVFFGNLTANILYSVIDPKIRRGQSREL